MITLIIDPATGNPDIIRIFSPLLLPPAFELQWYVSWEAYPVAALPYSRNFGLCPGGPPAIDMTPPPTAAQPELVIRQISVFNPGQNPVHLIIQFYNLAFPLPSYSILMACTLGASNTLIYNANPGMEGSWQIYDGGGILVSQS
jgi:hypothetical protein